MDQKKKTPPTHNIVSYDKNGNVIHCGWARVAIDKNGYPFLQMDLVAMPRGGRLYAHLTKAQKAGMDKPTPPPAKKREAA